MGIPVQYLAEERNGDKYGKMGGGLALPRPLRTLLSCLGLSFSTTPGGATGESERAREIQFLTRPQIFRTAAWPSCIAPPF